MKLSFILLVFCVGMFILSAGTLPVQAQLQPQPDTHQEEIQREEYYRGRVLEVHNLTHQTDFASLEQVARVEITGGPYQGEVVTVDNYYDERNARLNIKLEEGQRVILVAFFHEDEVNFYLQDLARDRSLIFLLVIFIALLLIIGARQGLKTILTLGLTGLLVIKVMFPLLLAGYSPVPVAALISVVIIFTILLIIGGFNRKSLAAIVGTSAGVLVAGVLALYAGNAAHLTGFIGEEAQMLLLGDADFDIQGLLFAGIIIGSLGAVTDVGMSIASAAEQIKAANPQISFSELTWAALNVGRDIMGTMANTLILAYAGGAIHLLLLLMRFENSWLKIINLDFMATEVVRGLAGSIGLLVSIPVTAFIAGILFINRGTEDIEENPIRLT